MWGETEKLGGNPQQHSEHVCTPHNKGVEAQNWTLTFLLQGRSVEH